MTRSCAGREEPAAPAILHRAGVQPQDRQGARPHDPAVVATASRPGHRVACSTHAASSCVLLSALLDAPCPSYDCALHALRTWMIRGLASGASRWECTGRAMTCNGRSTTSVAGERPSTRTGMEHSPTGATGTGWERKPWRAVQVAGWQALRNARQRRRV